MNGHFMSDRKKEIIEITWNYLLRIFPVVLYKTKTAINKTALLNRIRFPISMKTPAT